MRPRLRWSPWAVLLLFVLAGCSNDGTDAPVRKDRMPVTTQLTANDAVFEGNPIYSPDGQWILFESEAAGNRDIWMMPAGGGSPVQLTDHPAFDSTPFWSPDGRRFVFESERSGFKNIWIYDLDDPAAGPVALTEGAWDDGSPCWSPDGAWIAYESNRDKDGGEDLWMSPAGGGPAVRLTTSGDGVYHRTADFAPDSTRLVFESNRRQGASALYTLELAGGEPVRITDLLGYEGHPAWSPDGLEIAYESAVGGTMEIYVVAPEGGAPLQVTDAGGFWPRWAPDGTRIVYGVFGAGEPNIWAVEVDW